MDQLFVANTAPYLVSLGDADLRIEIEYTSDEIYNGYLEPIFEYRTPTMKDAESDVITV